jgi:hypothetical protein
MADYKGNCIFTQPGKSMDQGEDFTDWDNRSLDERVRLVKDFDKTVKQCQAVFIDYCKQYAVEEKTIQVPKTIKVLKAV